MFWHICTCQNKLKFLYFQANGLLIDPDELKYVTASTYKVADLLKTFWVE